MRSAREREKPEPDGSSMKTKNPATEQVSATDEEGDSLCFRGCLREPERDPVMDLVEFPERARWSLLDLRRRTLRLLEALQASTWILLEREIATASRETAQRLAANCSREELSSIHDELLRALDGAVSSSDSDLSDLRFCAELLSGSRLLLHVSAELGRAR
jgi:hypothetical protein